MKSRARYKIDQIKWKAKSNEHANALCDLMPYQICQDNRCAIERNGGYCGAWDEIDPFKRKLLELKYRRLQHEVESKV